MKWQQLILGIIMVILTVKGATAVTIEAGQTFNSSIGSTLYADEKFTADLIEINSSGIYVYNASFNISTNGGDNNLTCAVQQDILVDANQVNSSQFIQLYSYRCEATNITLEFFTLDNIQSSVSVFWDRSTNFDTFIMTEDFMSGTNATYLNQYNLQCSFSSFNHTTSGLFVSQDQFENYQNSLNIENYVCPGGTGGGGSGDTGGGGGGGGGGSTGGIITNITSLGGAEVLQPTSGGVNIPFCKAGQNANDIPITLLNPHPTTAFYSFEYGGGLSCDALEPLTVDGKETVSLTLKNCACPPTVDEIINGILTIHDERDPLAFTKIPVELKGSSLGSSALIGVFVGIVLVLIVFITIIVMATRD